MSQQLTKFQTKIPQFPIHSQITFNKYLSIPINQLVKSYHSSAWINFQDCIHYQDNQQYLKRFYKQIQFKNKIKLLGDYYRYHFEAPRIFMQGIARIIQLNIQDKRQLEYQLVTKQMKNKESQDQEFPVINSYRANNKYQKLIKDVELSYDDFQQRNMRKQVLHIQTIQRQDNFKDRVKINDASIQRIGKTQKTMRRVDSIKFKGELLLFKPKNQINYQQQEKKPRAQIKYKKPKQQKKIKKNQNLKQQITSKSKQTLKVISVNNSLASSNHGLSRSKSRTQLNVIKNNKFVSNKQSKEKKKIYEKSNNPSLQNSMTKSLSKKQILGDKKQTINSISRKGSKIDLKSSLKNNQKDFKNDQNIQNNYENEKIIHPNPISRKSSQIQLETKPKKMFNKALQIKSKK